MALFKFMCFLKRWNLGKPHLYGRVTSSHLTRRTVVNNSQVYFYMTGGIIAFLSIIILAFGVHRFLLEIRLLR
jgi:hypothetical protein